MYIYTYMHTSSEVVKTTWIEFALLEGHLGLCLDAHPDGLCLDAHPGPVVPYLPKWGGDHSDRALRSLEGRET